MYTTRGVAQTQPTAAYVAKVRQDGSGGVETPGENASTKPPTATANASILKPCQMLPDSIKKTAVCLVNLGHDGSSLGAPAIKRHMTLKRDRKNIGLCFISR